MVDGINVLAPSSQNGLRCGFCHAQDSVQIHYAPWQAAQAVACGLSQQAQGYVRTALGFLIVTAKRFWSASPHANNNNNAWIVYFGNGNDNNNNKNNAYRVRLVRAREWSLDVMTSLGANTTIRHLIQHIGSKG